MTGDETVDLLLDVVCFEAGYYNTEKAGQGMWLLIYYEMWCVLKQVIPKKYDRDLLLDVVCFEAGYYNIEKVWQGMRLLIYY